MLNLALLSLLAVQIDVQPQDDFETIVEGAQAGDEIIFHEGAYQTTGYWGVTLMGTADNPIVIRAAEGEAVSITGIPAQNLIDISGSYYTFSGFELIGGSHGVRIATSDHATFEDLEIHDTGDVGISANRGDNVYEQITIRGVHIHHTAGTGECMYLGCNDGACTMFDSLIEFNWCHDTTNSSQGDGIELKTGSYNVTIRHNVIHDVKYPGITMYGTQGEAPNLVEGNLIWNVVDNGIQTVGDVTVRNNIVLATGNNGIHAKPSQGEIPTGVHLIHNTVIGAGAACLRANDWPANNGNTVAGNALFCLGGTAVKFANVSDQGDWQQNGYSGVLDGKDPSGTFELGDVDVELQDPVNLQTYPAPESSLIDAGAAAAERDFNCLVRDGSADVGAYEYMGPENPGWMPAPGFKSCAADGGDGDGDGDGDSGSGDGDGDDPSTSGDGDGDPSTSGDGDGDPAGDGDGDGGSAEAGDTDTDGGSETGSDAGLGGSEDGDGCSCSSNDDPRSGLGVSLLLLGLLGLRRRRRV